MRTQSPGRAASTAAWIERYWPRWPCHEPTSRTRACAVEAATANAIAAVARHTRPRYRISNLLLVPAPVAGGRNLHRGRQRRAKSLEVVLVVPRAHRRPQVWRPGEVPDDDALFGEPVAGRLRIRVLPRHQRGRAARRHRPPARAEAVGQGSREARGALVDGVPA